MRRWHAGMPHLLSFFDTLIRGLRRLTAHEKGGRLAASGVALLRVRLRFALG